MTNPLTASHFQSVLEFPFRRPQGIEKLAIGSLLTLMSFIVPLVPLVLVIGYQVAVARRAIRSGELELPEWAEWSQLLVDGLKAWGVTLIYLLPAVLAFVLGYAGMFGASFGAALVEEAGLVEIVPAMPLLLIGSLGGISLFGLGMVLALVAAAVLSPALMHMIAKDEFAAAFRVREWWAVLRANLSGFILATVLVLGLTFVFSFLVQILQFTIVLCCLVPVAYSAYTMYVGTICNGLYGLVYRDATARLAGEGAARPAPAAGSEAVSAEAGSAPLAAP